MPTTTPAPAPGRLSSGAALPGRAGRPSRAAAGGGPRRPHPAGVIVGVLVRATAAVAALTAAVAATGWAAAVTTIAATPVLDERVLLVQRGAWTQGLAPAGSLAAVLPSTPARDAAGRLGEALGGYPGLAVVAIRTAPFTPVTVAADGTVTADGRPLPGTAPAGVTSGRLPDAYLASCVAGACETGQLLLVPTSTVLGQAHGTAWFDGYLPLTDSQDIP